MPTDKKWGFGPVPKGAYYTPPLGIMYVSSYLKSKGFDIDCLNMNHHGYAGFSSMLNRTKYDAICTGGAYDNIKAFREIFKAGKESNQNTKVILGGPAATAHPEFIVSSVGADFLVLREGEEVLCKLLAAINNNSNPEEVPGISFIRKKDKQFIRTDPHPPIKDVDALPYPDRDGFEFEYFLNNFPDSNTLDIGYTRGNLRTAGIVGARGCPGKCTFCFKTMSGGFRLRSVENIIGEIEYLKKGYAIDTIAFLDALFSTDKARVYDFCRNVKPLKVNWWCQMRVTTVDEKLLMTMKDAGSVRVCYGFESANDKVLKNMRKGIRVKDIKRALHFTRKARLAIQALFIFGDPAETIETADETLKFWRRYKSFNIPMITVIPFPGTALYNNLVRKGAIKNLQHFWENDCIDENRRSINLTSLDDNEEKLIRARIFVEKLIPSFYKVRNMSKDADGRYVLPMVCPVCQEEMEEIFVGQPVIVACARCCQTSRIDPLDIAELRVLKRRFIKSGRYIISTIMRSLLKNKAIGIALVRFFILSKKWLHHFTFLNQFGINPLRKSKTFKAG